MQLDWVRNWKFIFSKPFDDLDHDQYDRGWWQDLHYSELPLSMCFGSDQFRLYFLKLANKTDMESQVKQAKSETYNYKQMNLPTFCVKINCTNCSLLQITAKVHRSWYGFLKSRISMVHWSVLWHKGPNI